MALKLVDDDLNLCLALPVDAASREAISIQIQRSASNRSAHSFEMRLVKRLIDLVDTDLQPPTEKQLAYALNVAKSLGVAIPAEALRFRGSMNEFLDRFKERYQAQQLADNTAATNHGDEMS